MIQVASIRLGWSSGKLTSAIQCKSDQIQIYLCFSRSTDKCSEFSQQFQTRIHNNYDEVLSDSEIDAGRLRIQYPGKPVEPIELDQVDTLKPELEELARECEGDEPFRVHSRKAASNVAVMEAISESAQIGKTVDFDKKISFSMGKFKH